LLTQVHCIEFNSRMWVSSLQLTPTDRPASFKAARHRSRYSAAGDSYSCIYDPTHCSRDKHL